MTIIEFPPVELADEYGLLAVGGDLEIDSLLLAYRNGIFPWPFDKKTLAWFSPPKRAVIEFDAVHISTSLKKAQRQSELSFRFNTNFPAVINACAEIRNRGKQKSTWITPELLDAYRALHAEGFAHSIEAYDRNNSLAGGLYGVSLGKMFAGESMFYRQPNASKLALLYLIEHLREQGGTWLDCQVMTPLAKSLGAVEVSRQDFMARLREEINRSPFKFD